MHEFENEEHKMQEFAELESTKDDLRRMAADGMKDEIKHLYRTISLAEEAIDHGWYSLYICHKAIIAAGMDLIFARLSANF
ncbi:hypothetical protein PMAYCL1PPCAC_14924 [Pristionchus mayeri]|uniref:Uncharacterized protein n=1 Tax=Pristionchus mayeri TaxID=1317129 RepID=A0AAN5HXD2_9BILA|nr:hypothetical protein PMAYCL1PPCAC_14924 [Pristionchus mayeri]